MREPKPRQRQHQTNPITTQTTQSKHLQTNTIRPPPTNPPRNYAHQFHQTQGRQKPHQVRLQKLQKPSINQSPAQLPPKLTTIIRQLPRQQRHQQNTHPTRTNHTPNTNIQNKPNSLLQPQTHLPHTNIILTQLPFSLQPRLSTENDRHIHTQRKRKILNHPTLRRLDQTRSKPTTEVTQSNPSI